MIKKRINIIVMLVLIASTLNSNAQAYQQTGSGIKTTVNGMNIELQFYNSSIIRVIKYPVTKSFAKESLAVISGPAKTNFTIKQAGSLVILKTGKLTADINLESGTINFYEKTDNPLLKERPSGTIEISGDRICCS